MKRELGQKYKVKFFLEEEEMEYVGQIKTEKFNGSTVDIKFDVWRRWSYGRPDLFCVYNGKFFTRCYDNKVETLQEEIGKNFRFEGVGRSYITVGSKDISIEEFRKQVSGLLIKEEIDSCVLRGRFSCANTGKGEIKYCPSCQVIRQTSCCACGCGSCEECGYRWSCRPDMPTAPIAPIALNFAPTTTPNFIRISPVESKENLHLTI